MATYTDNYQLTLPTYAEVADIATINNNMTKIDEIMHDSQISIATAYDATRTSANPYNTGDIVMYEKIAYKCKEDGVYGTWDETKWEQTTLADNLGGGDASEISYDNTTSGMTATNVQNAIDELQGEIEDIPIVEANPQGEATEELSKVGINNTIYKMVKGESVYGSSSGAIATFTDGDNNKPLKSLKVAINPVQDLHGYDRPWLSGDGKNKFDYESVESVNNLSNNNGTFTNTATDTRTDFILAIQQYNGATPIKSDTLTISASGRYSVPFTVDAEITKLRIKHNGATTEFRFDYPFTRQGTCCLSLTVISANPTEVGGLSFKDVMIEEGNTATSYEPYSNICPISGWTGAKIIQRGKNLIGGIDVANRIKEKFENNATINTENKTVAFNPTLQQGFPSLLINKKYPTDESIAPFPYYYPYKDNTQYTFIFKCNNSSTTSTFLNIGVSYTDGTNNGGFKTTQRDNNGYIVWTSPADKTVLSFYIGRYATPTTTLYYDTVGVFEGVATLDDFVPYNTTNLYEVAWSEAGTVYGGEINIRCINRVWSGEIEEGYKRQNLGDLNWSMGADNLFYSTGLPNECDSLATLNAMCDSYKIVAKTTSSSILNNEIVVGSNYVGGSTSLKTVLIRDTNYSTASDFKTAMDGVYLVYKTKEIIHTYTINPSDIPNITTLLGDNNLWSNMGDITECVYQKDLNIVINEFDARITALEQALNSSGTRSLSLSKSATKEETEETKEEPKEEETKEEQR